MSMREDVLLADIYARCRAAGERVLIGPGDDMALLHLEDRRLLVAVDQVIEGRHFDATRTSPEEIASKAVARCISDVAAMAGIPLASLAACVLPSRFPEEGARRLFAATHDACRRLGAELIGGDLASHGAPDHPLTLSITVLAAPGPAGAIRRSGARPGDRLYVTGELGATLDPDGRGHHLTFRPRVAEALALAEALGPRLHAMVDLSDGLGRDADHIATQSRVVIETSTAALPCRHGCSWRCAAGDGEDYELCFAAEGPVPAHLVGVRVTEIGTVRAPEGGEDPAHWLTDGSSRWAGASFGWEHRGDAGGAASEGSTR